MARANLPSATPNPQSAPRGFWALIVTQAQGAFSDNALKWLAISLITGMGLSSEESDRLVSIIGALFALPFILFSMAGGFLADRFSKRTVVIGVKFFEILVMFIALAGLATNHIYVTIGGVFLMGVHSAFFGPSKYGLLPELLPERKISWGNGYLELGTFLAIIGGTVAGGWLCKTFRADPGWSGAILIALAVIGLFTAFGLDEVSLGQAATTRLDGSTGSEATVKLGKRISRDFYVAFERSLAGTMGTFYVFYDLSRRLTLRAESGAQSAVDLIFTTRYD